MCTLSYLTLLPRLSNYVASFECCNQWLQQLQTFMLAIRQIICHWPFTKESIIYIPYIIKWFQRGYKKETHPWNPCLPITVIAVKGPYLVASKKCLFVCVYVLLGRACSLIKKRLELKHNWVYLVYTKPYCLSWL